MVLGVFDEAHRRLADCLMRQGPLDIDDVVLRPLDAGDPADIEAALGVIVACEMAGLGWTDATAESVTSLFSGPDAFVAAQCLASSGDEPVGVLSAQFDAHGREIFLDAFAVGDDAGVLQQRLMAAGLSAAAEFANSAPGVAQLGADVFQPDARIWQVMTGAYEQDGVYRAVLRRLGFRPIRRVWRMEREVSLGDAVEPMAPPGVTRRVVRGDRDRRLMHRLFCESFAEHFGSSHDRPFEEWIASVEAGAGTDPSRWWLALLDDEPVGLCLIDDSKESVGHSYVRTLGVLPAARGRGIASWLLACAAFDAAGRGRTALALTVDGENTTGATALYAAAGFRVHDVIDVWCYPLLASTDSR